MSERPISLQQAVLQQIASIGGTVQSATVQAKLCHRQHRPDHGTKNGAKPARSDSQPAEYARRQRVSVLGQRAGPAVGRQRRSYSQRQRRAGGPQTGDRRTSRCRPGRRRARPPGHPGSRRNGRLGERGRRRLAVRPQARRGQFDAYRRDGHRPGRFAGRNFCRSRRRPIPSDGDTITYTFALPDGTVRR